MRAIPFIFLLLIVPVVYSANSTLVLRDVTTNNIISDVGVYVTDISSTYSYYVGDNGVLELDLDVASDVEIRADDYSTDGNDYFQIVSKGVFAGGTHDIYFHRVASINGMVKDSLDNVVPYANLKFSCSGQNLPFPSQTDEFGSFFVDFMPAGNCKVYATHGDSIGSVEMYVAMGNLSSVDINLDKSLINPGKSSLGYWIAAILLVIASVFFYFLLRSKPKDKKEVVEGENGLDKTSTKLLETLNEKERSVVDYLLSHENTSMQSSIRHATQIPRTTLCRVVDSLQRKKIIITEKMGKSVRLTLTDFFLDKE